MGNDGPSLSESACQRWSPPRFQQHVLSTTVAQCLQRCERYGLHEREWVSEGAGDQFAMSAPQKTLPRIVAIVVGEHGHPRRDAIGEHPRLDGLVIICWFGEVEVGWHG